MTIKYRLSIMFMALSIVVCIGWWSTGSFVFITTQFWFVAGALLLILLSLVDQPHFSKDANVFINGATAWVSLFSVQLGSRTSTWWIFFLWSVYLIASSFVLMALRSKPLEIENRYTQFFSRLNREVGKPEAIFSAFFLWGLFQQFSFAENSYALNSFLLFWAVFLILNVPGIAQLVSAFFGKEIISTELSGSLIAIRSPRVAEVRLNATLPENIVGKQFHLVSTSDVILATGSLIDDRTVNGSRVGRLVLNDFGAHWQDIASGRAVQIKINSADEAGERPVGIVSPGSSIGKLIFEVDPRLELHSGQVVKVEYQADSAYYQIVAATVAESALEDGNAAQSVRVTAGQLGLWNGDRSRFEAIDWVPQAGCAVVPTAGEVDVRTPPDCCLIGKVPSSTFPVHINIADAVTHNTALIGVTGSGKSYLAFHLIEALLDANIKVLILDMTRQHWQFLQHKNPVALAQAADVPAWLAGDSLLGIHQFANANGGFPAATANFVDECFTWLKQNVQLQAGVDAPAKLCIVMEEAHSLIPEWNQVAQQSDTQQVNKTARIVLQGRKFGLGTLLISQRTANVTKSILNQCNTLFAMRSFDQTGLDFLKNYMGEEYSQAISTLPDRTAILVGKASSSSRPIILRVDDFAQRWGAQPVAASQTLPVVPIGEGDGN